MTGHFRNIFCFICLLLPLDVLGQSSSTIISQNFFNGPGLAIFFEFTGTISKPIPPIFISSKKPNFKYADNIYKYEDARSVEGIKRFMVSEEDLKIIVGNVENSLPNKTGKNDVAFIKSDNSTNSTIQGSPVIVDLGIIRNNKMTKCALTQKQAILELSLVQDGLKNKYEDLLDAILYFKYRIGVKLNSNEKEKIKKGLRLLLNY